jgi:hypothetical protein
MLFNKLAIIFFMSVYIYANPIHIAEPDNPRSSNLVIASGDGAVTDVNTAQETAAIGSSPTTISTISQSFSTNNVNINAITNNAAENSAANKSKVKTASQGNLKQAAEEELKAVIQKANDAKEAMALAGNNANVNATDAAKNTGKTVAAGGTVANANTVIVGIVTVNADGTVTSNQAVQAAGAGLSLYSIEKIYIYIYINSANFRRSCSKRDSFSNHRG